MYPMPALFHGGCPKGIDYAHLLLFGLICDSMFFLCVFSSASQCAICPGQSCIFNLQKIIFFFIKSLSAPSLMKSMTGNKNFRTRQRHLSLKPRKKKKIFFQKKNAFNNSWKTARTLRSVWLNIQEQEAKWKRKV